MSPDTYCSPTAGAKVPGIGYLALADTEREGIDQPKLTVGRHQLDLELLLARTTIAFDDEAAVERG